MAIRTAVQNSRNSVLIHRDDGSIVVVIGEFLGSTSTTVTTRVSSNCGNVYDENGRLIQTIPLYNPPNSRSSSSAPSSSTTPSSNSHKKANNNKKGIIMWLLQGFIEFSTGDAKLAEKVVTFLSKSSTRKK